jgi:acrylyl-CoA reductase (NADPH)
MSFKGILVDKIDEQYTVSLRDLDESVFMEGDTVVKVSHSSINYKDGLAVTGKGPVVRRFPMVPGIDMAGVIESTTHPGLEAGQAVILNGWGTGETHLGAFAEKSRVWGKWLLPLPAGFTPWEAMAIGTAGYTAALCVTALQKAGVKPSDGDVLVTGAAGGVGSVAIALLAAAGWRIVACTGRPEEEEYVRRLGASEVISRDELAKPGKPLGKERWAAAVDVVGTQTLANVLASIKYGGFVAACGLAGGMDLPSTVAPFILRGVSLLGIDSVYAPIERRREAWELLRTLDKSVLRDVTKTISLNEAIAAGEDILAGKIRGRVVIQVANDE